MPLPCVEEVEEEKQLEQEAVGRALVEVVKQGLDEDRVTCGIQPCIDLMGSGPDHIMFCLLVQLSAALDAAMTIPLVLIRAFCQENDIDLLHVQGQNKMTQLWSTCLSQSAKCSSEVMAKPSPAPKENDPGLGCIMIKYPKHDTSFEDDTVAGYIKEKMQNRTDPSVMFPDLSQDGVDKTLGFKLKRKKMKTPIQASSQPTSAFQLPQ